MRKNKRDKERESVLAKLLKDAVPISPEELRTLVNKRFCVGFNFPSKTVSAECTLVPVETIYPEEALSRTPQYGRTLHGHALVFENKGQFLEDDCCGTVLGTGGGLYVLPNIHSDGSSGMPHLRRDAYVLHKTSTGHYLIADTCMGNIRVRARREKNAGEFSYKTAAEFLSSATSSQ